MNSSQKLDRIIAHVEEIPNDVVDLTPEERDEELAGYMMYILESLTEEELTKLLAKAKEKKTGQNRFP